MNKQYADLKGAKKYDSVLLFFDACLFDQSMLCHILTCAKSLKLKKMELLCIDSFPTISPYHGIGQLSPEQIASVYNKRQTLTDSQYIFAEQVDKAFAAQDPAAFDELVNMHEAPLPWVPAAIKRWIEEMPDKISGLGRLEHLILEALQNGKSSPWEIYSYVSALETPPQYWGDTTLWLKINGLADRNPPLIKIEGPHPRLPQWKGTTDLKLFKVVVV